MNSSLISTPAAADSQGRTPLPRLRPWLCLLLAAAVLSLWQAAAPAQTVMLTRPAGDGNHGIEIMAPLGDRLVPADGFLPLVVRLTNHASTPRQWQVSVEVRVSEYSYSFRGYEEAVSGVEERLTAAPGQVSTHEILVPMPGPAFDTRSCSIHINARTGGVNTQTWKSPTMAGRHGISLVSGQVARMNLSDLTSAATAKGSSWDFGVQVAAPELPRNWRALIGWRALLIGELEWDGLTPEQRQAARQWVRFGGNLLVFTETADLEAVLQRVGGNLPAGPGIGEGPDVLTTDSSLGKIQIRRWNGNTVEADAVVDFLLADTSSNLSQLALPGEISGPDVVPKLSSGNVMFGFLLIAYCLVMGPVNLYLFAPATRRHRLFFTTPLIAIGAAGLMFGVGLLRDGIGVMGARSVFVELRPDESMAYLHQCQIYRSGMVGNGSFDEQTPTVVHLLSNSGAATNQRLFYQDGRWSGTLFGSRQRQAHRINATRSTRERLEWREPQAGQANATVSSTLGWPVDELWVQGKDGTWWRSQGTLAPGGQIEMTRAADRDARMGVNLLLAQAPVADHPALKAIQEQPGRFFALTKTEGAAAAVPTLASAKWTQTTAVTTGPMVARGTSASAPAPNDSNGEEQQP